MKKTMTVLFLLSAALSVAPLPATPIETYEPYTEEEFPLWTYKIRRAETLFFGSLAITLPVASLAYSVAVNYLSFSAADSDIDAFLLKLGIAASLSASISLADYVIGEVQEQ
jgi:hypothetical protein